MPDRSSHVPSATVAPALRSLATEHPWSIDMAIAAVVLLVYSMPFVFPWGDTTRPPTWQGYLLVAGAAGALIWRRRMPLTSALAVACFTVVSVLYHRPGQPMQYAAVVSVFTMAAVGAHWQRRATLTLWCAGIVIVSVVDDTSTAVGTAFAILSVVSAYGLGVYTRIRRAYTAALEERAMQLEEQRQMEVERATAHERARIAREMHDILAHAVSLMVVQAEAGPVAVRADPERALKAFSAIAGAGRDAMVQLRRILDVLKDSDGAVDHAPSPTVARLPELITQVRRTGVRVELVETGDAVPLHADVDVAAFRIVQEALTNTVKHADARAVIVRLEWRTDTLTVTVTDDGRGATDLVAGHGLIGIQQRAAACGGTAAAGPGHAGRGFIVTAQLPAAVGASVTR